MDLRGQSNLTVMNDHSCFSSNPFPDERLVALNTMSKADHSRVLRYVHKHYTQDEVQTIKDQVIEAHTEDLSVGKADVVIWAKRIHMSSTLIRLGLDLANYGTEALDEIIALNDAMVALVAPLGGVGPKYETLSWHWWLWVLIVASSCAFRRSWKESASDDDTVAQQPPLKAAPPAFRRRVGALLSDHEVAREAAAIPSSRPSRRSASRHLPRPRRDLRRPDPAGRRLAAVRTSLQAADDVPTHHFLGSFLDLARRMAGGGVVLLFRHDLLNACRQWPVRCPAHCGTFLDTPAGPTFWYHLAMIFGATASVWKLEIFAQVVALAAVSTHLLGAVTAFIDNATGSGGDVYNGYGTDPAMNGMLAAFWALAARQGTVVDFRRVPSKANVADAVSRDDFDRARREGWTRVIMHILAKVVDDLLYAVDGAADDLLACSTSWFCEPARCLIRSFLPVLSMAFQLGIPCTWRIIRPDATIFFPPKRPRMGLWWNPELLSLVPRYFLLLHALLVKGDDGLLKGLREGVESGDLALAESLTLMVQLMVNMTSANALCSLVFRLASEKEAFRQVSEDISGTADRFIQEVLRLDSPLQRNPRRYIKAGAKWTGGRMPFEGDQVLLFLGAANMDPAVYKDPQQFRLDRHEEPPPLTFGSGMHYCLGSSLVKLELRLALQHLCRHCQSIELNGDFERLADVDVGNWGFRRLNVRLVTA
ncbi:Cytochrome P450 144 [Symbiodinium microadriaticum]|uniref:Cytochrome P450 144 n=1 Tax=Symbiodinium microadriaticum TaxID=2951 RepID=A0A1Q9D998_SYMMI|nr:Cytochrome P450 144 [Symbiodinium microadriaticum]